MVACSVLLFGGEFLVSHPLTAPQLVFRIFGAKIPPIWEETMWYLTRKSVLWGLSACVLKGEGSFYWIPKLVLLLLGSLLLMMAKQDHVLALDSILYIIYMFKITLICIPFIFILWRFYGINGFPGGTDLNRPGSILDLVDICCWIILSNLITLYSILFLYSHCGCWFNCSGVHAFQLELELLVFLIRGFILINGFNTVIKLRKTC